MTITLEGTGKRLEEIAAHAAEGKFELVERQARLLVEDLGRASRPVYPDYKTAKRSGNAPTWDPHHQRYAAALLHLRAAVLHASHADSDETIENLQRARKALEPRAEATE